MRLRPITQIVALVLLAGLVIRSRAGTAPDPLAAIRKQLEGDVRGALARGELARAEKALAAAPFGVTDELALEVATARLAERRRAFETTVLQGGRVPTPF